MDRFQRTIDVTKKLFGKKSSDEEILDGFTEAQLAGIKNLAKRKEVEGALDELERAQPFLELGYYRLRYTTLQKRLAELKSSKKETRVVEIRFVG